MNTLHHIAVTAVLAVGTAAQAGAVVDLAPSQFHSGLSGIKNSEFSELIGTAESDKHIDFSIFDSGRGGSPLFEATLMTRVVRSSMTGNLHFNYRILDANGELDGRISHIEVSGFEGFHTRVEFRNELTSPGVEGPYTAERGVLGDIINFGFDTGLDTNADSRYFFAMVNTDTFFEDSAVATIYLESGQSVSLMVDSATAGVPTPGGLMLLSGAGLLASRRRR